MAGPGGDREPLGEDELVEMKDEVDDAMLSRMLVKDILGVRMEGSDIWPEAGLQVCVCVHVCARMRERERERESVCMWRLHPSIALISGVADAISGGGSFERSLQGLAGGISRAPRV